MNPIAHEWETKRLALILRRVIMHGFPEVKRLRVRIGFAELSEGECLNYEVEGRRYRINVSPMLRRAPRKALEGGIAHELSHILHDSRMGSYQFEQAMKRYAASTAYRTRDERATEARAIERGYGAHLLAFTRYAKHLGIVFRRENGLLPGEIVARLKAQQAAGDTAAAGFSGWRCERIDRRRGSTMERAASIA